MRNMQVQGHVVLSNAWEKCFRFNRSVELGMGIATHSVSELDIAEQESPWSPSNSQRKGSLLALQSAAAAQTSLLAVQKVRKPSTCFMAQLRKAFFIFKRCDPNKNGRCCHSSHFQLRNLR